MSLVVLAACVEKSRERGDFVIAAALSGFAILGFVGFGVLGFLVKLCSSRMLSFLENFLSGCGFLVRCFFRRFFVELVVEGTVEDSRMES